MKMIEVVAAIIERDGKILLAQRPTHSDQAGLWEFAGGKVEPDESQRQALVRELREELGTAGTIASLELSELTSVGGVLSVNNLAKLTSMSFLKLKETGGFDF